MSRKLKSASGKLKPMTVMSIGSTYALTISYHLSLAEMVAGGGYDFVDPDIPIRSLRVKRDRTSVEAVLVGFNRTITHTDALKNLERLGLRPGSMLEGLALESQYPDPLQDSSIVMLGSSWEDRRGYLHVSYLMGVGEYRQLLQRSISSPWDLGHGYLWPTFCHFLAVRES